MAMRRVRQILAGSCGRVRSLIFAPNIKQDACLRAGYSAARPGVLPMRCSIGPLYGDLSRGNAVDPSDKFPIVANDGSGTVSVLPIAKDGSLKDQHQLVQLPGEPGPARSSKPVHILMTWCSIQPAASYSSPTKI
jgi:Lactonase, 7-bladed beta-propeller